MTHLPSANVGTGIIQLNQNTFTALPPPPQSQPQQISKNYIAKITDFGESYHPDVCKDNFKPGRTLPYASPEVIKDAYTYQKYHDRVDIFSLGILISDLLFDEYPVEFKRGNQHLL